jgi:hypothetical protein
VRLLAALMLAAPPEYLPEYVSEFVLEWTRPAGKFLRVVAAGLRCVFAA